MRYLIAIVLVLSLYVVTSCTKEGVCVSSSGEVVKEVRELMEFSKVEVVDNFTIEINHYSGAPYLEVIAGENLQPGIKTDVTGGILKLENLNKCNWLRDLGTSVTIQLYVDSLEEIFMEHAAGLIQCFDTIYADIFTLNTFTSSTDVSLILKASEVYVKNNVGSTFLTISGQSDYTYVYNGAVGDINTVDLKSEITSVEMWGYGDIYAFADSIMYINNSGVGNVYRNADVSVVEITGTGSGIVEIWEE